MTNYVAYVFCYNNWGFIFYIYIHIFFFFAFLQPFSLKPPLRPPVVPGPQIINPSVGCLIDCISLIVCFFSGTFVLSVQ